MKKIIVLLTLSIPSIAIFAQPDSLLKKFKYRIDHYQAINFNIGAGGQYSQVDYVAGTHKNSAASGGFSGGYYFTKSTDRIQLTTTANLNGAFNSSKSKDQTNTGTGRYFSSSPGFSILNKWFSKKMFTELGAAVSGNFYLNKDKLQGYPAALKNNNTGYSASLTFGIGTGRLENVSDMQNAIWLYKVLIKEQRLAGTLSANDLLELGQSITKGNNTRVLDARKRTQFLLTTVDNYLQQKGLINKTDIAYFSNLNDILFYAINNTRFAGTEKFVRLTPSASGSNFNQYQSNGIDKSKHNFTTQTALLSAGFKKYKPANLVHQNNYGIALNLSYTTANLTDRNFTNNVVVSEIKGKTDIKKAGASLFYQHTIYPNTRTDINFGLQTDLGYQDIDPKNFYATGNLYCSVNYFISYRTRLTAGAGAVYQRNTYTLSNVVEMLPTSFQLYTNAGLQINL